MHRRCVLLVSVLPILAQASAINTGQIGLNPNASGGLGPVSQNQNNAGPITMNASTTGGDNSTGTASLFVDYGVIKMSGDSEGTLVDVVRGIFRDDVTITAPGIPTGTLGSLQFSVSLNGSLAAPAGGGASSWQIQATIGGTFQISTSATQFNPDSGLGYVGPPFGVFTGTVNFQFGSAAQLDVELTGAAQTQFDFSGPGSASFDLAHSLYWDGISNVTANSAPVNNFIVTSTSGTNYAQSFVPAVPEPTTLLLTAGALAVLASGRLRGGRRRR